MNKFRAGRKNKLDQMLSTIEQLAAQVKAQEAELKGLREQIGLQAQAIEAKAKIPGQITSRKFMLRKLGAATAGLTLAGVALGTESSPAQAAADLSGPNTVNSTAIVRPTASLALPTMQIEAEQTGGTLNVTQSKAAALLVTGTGSNYGAIAVSGPADIAASDLTATPALKPAAIQGRSGMGTSSTDGNIGVHGISDAQAGVLGQYQGVAQVTQNLQINDTAGLLQAGVIGASDKGLGVVAASRNQSGLYASSSGALGYSIAASRGTHDALGNLTSLNLAPLYLEPSTEAGPPTSNGHRRGEVHVDANGKVWVCASDGSATAQPPGVTTPLELRKPSAVGIPSSGTFYQLSNLTFLANPIRILGPYNTVNLEFPTIVGNATPSYFKIEGNWLNKPPNLGPVSATIPGNALGIIGTISAFAAAGVGYLTIFPADAPTLPVVATLLYSGGSFANTSVTLKLGPIPAGQKDAGKQGIAVFVLTTCQIAFDVVGYIV